MQITILVSASIITISLSWLQILHSNTDMLQNILAYRIESFMNILVGISQYHVTEHSHIIIPFLIILTVFRQIVLSSINLNDNTSTRNIEVNNVITHILLPVDRHGKPFQKIIP